jgi:steroid 5-alpha reductase family enzyme
MQFVTPLAPFVAGWVLLFFTADLGRLGLVNSIGQLVLFAFAVCLPVWKTGRMSYVDIGWPLGVAVIGALAWALADGDSVRRLIVSLVYLFIGLRMGLGALKMWRMGFFRQEFPRYQYQRLRWERQGIRNIPLMMQVEALVQGFANMSFLAFPAFLIATNASDRIHVLEIIGLLLWVGAFVMESVADGQKLAFLREMKKRGLKNQVCNVGLWRYSRHPNYFAEWMVWNALVIAAIPSWLARYGHDNIVVWVLLGVGLVNASRLMYITLVHYTGAKPAEYFSAQKRPAYKAYQQTTNMFFPGPVRPTGNDTDS